MSHPINELNDEQLIEQFDEALENLRKAMNNYLDHQIDARKKLVDVLDYTVSYLKNEKQEERSEDDYPEYEEEDGGHIEDHSKGL
jgi:hypothetical protein